MFIKGHLQFELDGKKFEFIHQNISLFGVSGLSWSGLNPKKHFGATVKATVKIPCKPPVAFVTKARIVREATTHADYFGLKFLLDKETLEKLDYLLAEKGSTPSTHKREYPRIPSNDMIQTFPLRANIRKMLPGSTTSVKSERPLSNPIICDVENISPNGFLLATENRFSAYIKPGDKIEITLEPRGWFPMAVKLQARVCRTIDDINTRTNNQIRRMGVLIQKIEPIHKAAFLDLMKDILKTLGSK